MPVGGCGVVAAGKSQQNVDVGVGEAETEEQHGAGEVRRSQQRPHPGMRVLVLLEVAAGDHRWSGPGRRVVAAEAAVHLDDGPAPGADVESVVVPRRDAGIGSCRFQQRIEVGRPDFVDRELRDQVMALRWCPVRRQLVAQVILQRRAPTGTVLLVVLGKQRQVREFTRYADLGGERAQEVAPGRQSGRRGQTGAHEQRGDAGIDSAAEDAHELVPVDGHPNSVPRPARARSPPRISEIVVPPVVLARL